jgi:citrate synthase
MKTRIAKTESHAVTVRGLDLVDDVIGVRSFTEMVYFLTVGRLPKAEQTRVLDACLVTLIEHGWTPSSLVTRMMIDSVPDEVQVAMASGLLALGSVFAGTSENCARILAAGIAADGDADAYCQAVVADHRARKAFIPGFGHPVHKPDDPRSIRLLAIGRDAGFSGGYIAMLERLGEAVDRAFGKHVAINATGAIAALLLEIDVPPDLMRGMAVVSRAGGLIGHVAEERETHSARHIWKLAEDNIPYEG